MLYPGWEETHPMEKIPPCRLDTDEEEKFPQLTALAMFLAQDGDGDSFMAMHWDYWDCNAITVRW